MIKRLMALALLAATVALPSMVSAAFDQSLPSLKPGTFKPMFNTGPKHHNPILIHPASSDLPQWSGTFTDLTGQTVVFTQVGGNPATTNSTTTVNVLFIPVKFVITDTAQGKTYTFDPEKKVDHNHHRSVLTAILDSPLFNSKVDFNPQGGSCSPNCVNLGKTQYIDAFQRGTWWDAVSTNTDYHVLLTPTMESEWQVVTTCNGCVVKNPTGGGWVGEYDQSDLDGQLMFMMSNIADVNPGVLPLFITEDIYLTNGGVCCVGGYHNALKGQPSGQTYAYATYVDSNSKNVFAQDVLALSHELGEWMDDPFADNYVNCTDNDLMEVGDPLAGPPTWGAYPYWDRGFTYHLQSLVYMPYFGAPQTDSANMWYSLQNDESQVCPGQ